MGPDETGLPALNFSQNGFQHTLDIGQHLIVPKTDHAHVKPLQISWARPILSWALGMLPPIHFDGQAPFTAHEIANERANRDLPREFMTVETAPTEVVPQCLLSIRWMVAQFLSSFRGSLSELRHASSCPPPAPPASGRGVIHRRIRGR